jgi:hypothetical protein
MQPAGIGLLLFADDSVDDRVPLGLAAVALVLFLIIITPVSVNRQLKDGLSLGADHTGVYLRPNLDRTRVVFVPLKAQLLNDLRYHAAGRTEVHS